ncbi:MULTISPECIES: DUF3015 family protein [Alteromonadaceae]|uniref:DUF3015 family protein n=1 Tax=Alteromonadaceae TaxID=72275 RepID=UPI001C0A4DBC|nr:DUF3015 family protein [Aliiglaciecola lipolytica]MBU2880001.1 DUF3015 domain-containing protein [Aliiglaciecola lipolytica]
MKKTTLVIALVTACLSTSATAQEKKVNPWKQCGIGAMIFDDNRTAAAISNVIWDLGTTAVSSNVSSQDSCKGIDVTAGLFIQQNFDIVVEQISQGEGDHLNAILDILEVEIDSRADVIANVRSNAAIAIAANSATPESVYNIVVASI